jgi:DNA-binding XRE family transcriptional regulator
MTTLSKLKKKLMKNPRFQQEYETLKPEYELVEKILTLRKENSLTQQELATKTGIARSNIARLESGSYNPSVAFLARIANGLGKRLEINFR